MIRKSVSRTATALLVAAAAALGLSAPMPAQAQEKVVFGFPAPHNVQFSYFWYGSKLGFFKEEGLALDVITVTGSGVLLPQVASGQVHMGYANPDLTIIALAKGEPLPVRFVMNWLRSQTFEFVVLDQSPVKTLADLKGRKMGVGALTWGNLPLSKAMLASVDVAWNKQIEVLPVGLGAAAWRRLQSGEVDALNLFVGEHGRMELAGIPIRRLPMPDQFRTIFSNGFVMSDKVIAERPKLVVGMGRAITKSWLACKANVEACVRAYWEAHPTVRPAPGKEAEQLKTDMRQAMFDINQIDDFSGGGPRKPGFYPEDAWKRLIKVMHDEKLIGRADLDLSKLYTGQFVDEINAFDAAAVERQSKAAK
jgi:NitT/TauT family transport system substrate-binding protein